MKVSKTRGSLRVCLLLSLAVGLTSISACDSTAPSNSNTAATPAATQPTGSNANPASPPATGPNTTSKRASSGATGTLTVNPNPIQACDASGMGAANLSWNFSGAQLVEIRMGAPDGTLIAQAGALGSKTTGKFIAPGTVFYLQDVTNGLPRNAANTMATVTVTTTRDGCR
ncbi:MAG TPA: hypothetical protein VEW46_06210 [Pyrinomonadaceae bacterium]|nr:hypothetical protein [Pyrinomonadaceae bacterium]